MTFCVVRDAITELRPVMSSRRAFKRLIQEYERHDDGEKALWVRVLQHMYNNSKTPIYSILAMRDPCVRHFHQLIQTAITLSCPRLFFVVLLLFAKCTNRKMQVFLRTHLADLLDEKRFAGWLASRLKSDLEALESAGGLTACTKLGNGPNEERIPDIIKGLYAIAEVDFSTLQASMQSILTGKVECNKKSGS